MSQASQTIGQVAPAAQRRFYLILAKCQAFADRVERRPVLVELFNALEVCRGEPSHGIFARVQLGLQFGDGQFFHFEA